MNPQYDLIIPDTYASYKSCIHETWGKGAGLYPASVRGYTSIAVVIGYTN